MFTGLTRYGAAAAAVVGASALGVVLAVPAAPAAMAAEADVAHRAIGVDPDSDFLTVASSPAGGFENLAPGDTVSWFVTARSSAPVESAVSLRVQSDSISALLTDATQGLRMQLTACSTSWTGTGDTLRCPGVATAIASGPLALLLGGYELPRLPAASSAHYLAQVTVPPEATNDVAGQTADLRFELTAVRDEADAGAPPAPATPPAVPNATPAPDGTPAAGGVAAPQPSRAGGTLANTGVDGAPAFRNLALALLAAGSLVLVFRRMGID